MRARGSWVDRNRRQILKPALRLHKTMHLRRQPPRVEVVRDKDQRRLFVHRLVELGQQGQPFSWVELAEDLLDQFVDRRVAVMPPITALGRPWRGPDVADQGRARGLGAAPATDPRLTRSGAATRTAHIEDGIP